MVQPLISICIPAFKAEKYLEAALASVRAQTMTDWEVIVTEDGSQDRTAEIVSSFAGLVPQAVIYNRHAQNQGLPATRNTGIGVAQGTWIAFLDADDVWKPEHLTRLLEASNQEPCDLAYAGSQVFDDATGAEMEKRAPTPDDLSAFPSSIYLSKLVIQPSSAMVRRERIATFGLFSRQYPICNDLEFWLRAASRGAVFRYSGFVTCLYRKHPQAMSQKAAALIAETAKICEEYQHWEAIPAVIRERHPAHLYQHAGRILLRENPRAARRLFAQSMRLRKRPTITLGYWLAASLLGLAQRAPL